MSSSIFVNGPEMWNSLPNELKTAQNHNIFKGSLKRLLLCKYHKKTECSNPRCKDKILGAEKVSPQSQISLQLRDMLKNSKKQSGLKGEAIWTCLS